MRRAAILLSIVIAAAWWARRGPDACPLAQQWNAPAPHYDYFQSIRFAADGSGRMAMGEGQAVRSDLAFRYRVDGHVLELRYGRGSSAGPRKIAFRSDEGDFVVVDPGYDKPVERHFRCRLHFAESPFPPDAASDDHRDYFACER